ncbi:thyroglobulin-like [Paramacrobiotus metropolitanus]|uniref:thyroglobulin-like n=1 Tax=Paramacrobiotus metropolitanus TaxID=2943436 RepID=UPI00244576C9|nr:thyroglobulin-like [Paramacrobiotus metropolitanus]
MIVPGCLIIAVILQSVHGSGRKVATVQRQSKLLLATSRAARCLNMEQITVAGGAIRGYQNVQGCSCQTARENSAAVPYFPNGYRPQCTESGGWATLQTDGQKLNYWCVDSQGNQISKPRRQKNLSELPCYVAPPATTPAVPANMTWPIRFHD